MLESRASQVEIRVLHPGDHDLILHAAPDVFDHPPDPELTREFLQDPRHHITVALEAGRVVAFASGVHYIHPDKAPELWINEVAVAPAHRGMGFGKAVLKALLEVGRAHRCTTAWVLTYRNNPAAMALYSSLGGTEGADDSGPSNDLVGYSFSLIAQPRSGDRT